MMNSDDVHAFVRCLCHKEAAETGAKVLKKEGLTHLAYESELSWAWPRQFEYKAEYFCESPLDPATTLSEIGRDDAEHVVNIFHPEIAVVAEQLDLGHTLAWTSTLMARNLNRPWPRARSIAALPIEVRTAQEKDIADSLRGISNAPSDFNDQIHNFYVEQNGAAIAKGQLVYLGGDRAYISDMFTLPEHRRHGHCNALMAALESKGRSLGATRIVLAPGLEAVRFCIYDRYGYQQSAVRAVIIRSEHR